MTRNGVNAAELLRGEPSLLAIYERTVGALMRLPADALADELRVLIAGALRDAAEVGAGDPAPVTQQVRVVYEPQAGSVGVDVEDLAKGGVKLSVSVRCPREGDEGWDVLAEHATSVAHNAYQAARLHFPKDAA